MECKEVLCNLGGGQTQLVGYIRVSTIDQIEGTSLKTQRQIIEAYCKDHEHNLVHVFSDEGLSGKRGVKRPQYERMLKRLDDDVEVRGIIVASLSRLGRSMPDIIALVYNLQEQDGVFISVKEQFDMTTKEGRMLLNMMAAVNEYERELIRDRLAEGVEYAKVHGSKSGKPCYRPEKDIDWEKIGRLRDQNLSWSMIAKVLASDPKTKVTSQTLINRARKRGMKID